MTGNINNLIREANITVFAQILNSISVLVNDKAYDMIVDPVLVIVHNAIVSAVSDEIRSVVNRL